MILLVGRAVCGVARMLWALGRTVTGRLTTTGTIVQTVTGTCFVTQTGSITVWVSLTVRATVSGTQIVFETALACKR